MAFLNEQNEAKYSFYKIYPEERLKVDLPSFQADDILLFGGFYSLMSEVRQQLMSFVRAASKAGAFILYDPNIRSPHKVEINELRALIYENISLANIQNTMKAQRIFLSVKAAKLTKQIEEKNNMLRLSIMPWLFVGVKNTLINAAVHTMDITHSEILLYESNNGEVR